LALDQAEQWYQRSLDLRDKADWFSQARCLSSLGAVALQRFDDAQAAVAERLIARLEQRRQPRHRLTPRTRSARYAAMRQRSRRALLGLVGRLGVAVAPMARNWNWCWYQAWTSASSLG